jgi:hypothetical protein
MIGNVLPSSLASKIKDDKSSSSQSLSSLNPKTSLHVVGKEDLSSLPAVGNEGLSSQSSSSPPVLSIKDDSSSSQLKLPVTDTNIGKEKLDLRADSPYTKTSDNIICSYEGLFLDDKYDSPFLKAGRSINDTAFDLLVIEDIEQVSTISITHNVS